MELRSRSHSSENDSPLYLVFVGLLLFGLVSSLALIGLPGGTATFTVGEVANDDPVSVTVERVADDGNTDIVQQTTVTQSWKDIYRTGQPGTYLITLTTGGETCEFEAVVETHDVVVEAQDSDSNTCSTELSAQISLL